MENSMARKNKKVRNTVAAVVAVGCIGTMVVFALNGKSEDIENNNVTKETIVEQGNLVTGVTESGNVEVASVTQSFDADWSNSNQSSASSNVSGQGGIQAMDMSMRETQQSAQTSSASTVSPDEQLVVSKVYITKGQTVKEGDKILKVKASSVKKVRKIYEEAVETAELELEQAEIDRKSEKLDAEYQYKQRVAAGESAQTTYDAAILALQANVNQTQSKYDEAVKAIKTLPAKIKKLEKQAESEENTQSASTTTIADNTASQSVAAATLDKNMSGDGIDTTGNSMASQSQQLSVGTTTSQITELKQQLQTYKQNLSNLKAQLKSAKRALVSGKVSAKKTYDTAVLEYKNAKALYNAAIDGIDDAVNDAKDNLKQAKSELKEFNEYIGDGFIKAECTGTVVSVGYSAGESLSSDTAIATYMDEDNVTITVSVSQEDIADIVLGDIVNVYLKAYEDKTYHAEVTEISTASSSGTATVSYPVTVRFTEDTKGIYSGMTGDVTFVESEVSDVAYVSKKAVITENDKTYVLKKGESGEEKIEVTTGFTDGHNIEIKDGLDVGDIVLIESKVGK